MATAAARRTTFPLPFTSTPARCSDVFQVDYAKVAEDAMRYAAANGITAAGADKFKICVILIDMQIDFCQKQGALYVLNAEKSTARTINWLGINLPYITNIKRTIDTHSVHQIFHPAMFVDAGGKHPAPFTMISLQDVKSGKWRINPGAAFPVFGNTGNYMALQQHLEYYCEQLEKAGRYQLCVWPYHCLLGGIGHALVPSLQEALFFHSIARNAASDYEIKGGNPLTENYSPFSPEVLTTFDGRAIAQKNVNVLRTVMEYDAVIIAGQAKSHCVAWGIDSLLNDIKQKDPALAQKVWLLEDCTDPVIIPGIVDFTQQANDAFARFKSEGMNVIQSTTQITDYLPV